VSKLFAEPLGAAGREVQAEADRAKAKAAAARTGIRVEVTGSLLGKTRKTWAGSVFDPTGAFTPKVHFSPTGKL
jgi:hypothetical protein